MRKLIISAMLGMLGAWTISSPAAATSLIFEGDCTLQCSAMGLSSGDAISAAFDLGSLSSLDNLVLGKPDVLSFTVTAGTHSLTSATTTNWDFKLDTDAVGDVTDFQFLVSLGTNVTSRGLTFNLFNDGWSASTSGFCINPTTLVAVACDFSKTDNFAVTSNTNFSSGDSKLSFTGIPEPASLALLGAGLAGFRLMRRRRG